MRENSCLELLISTRPLTIPSFTSPTSLAGKPSAGQKFFKNDPLVIWDLFLQMGGGLNDTFSSVNNIILIIRY